MKLTLLKSTLPWLVLAVLLPVLALLITAGPVGAAGCCGGGITTNPPATAIVRVFIGPDGGGDVEFGGQLPASYPFVRIIEEGDGVMLEATPADGYYFVGWSGGLSGNTNPVSFKVFDDTNITARFFPEEIVSADNVLQLLFPEGTVVRDSDGDLLFDIELAIADTPPSPPPEAGIMGLPYELGPHGATFDQMVTMNFSFDPGAIPDGVAEGDLALGYYDDATGQWLLLPSTVNVASHTVSTRVNHLSTFAVVVPAPPPLPATFATSALNISPLETDIGEPVTISVLLTNTGEMEGSYSVDLKLNGVVVETKIVTLAGGSQTVSFSAVGDEAGTYSVAIDGLAGLFTVRETPIFSSGLSGTSIWVIVGVAIAALVVAIIVFIVKMRRRYDDYYYY